VPELQDRVVAVDALEFATCTDPGRLRPHNEDSIAADPAIGLVVLADGMGGHNAGEVASGIATTVIATNLQGLLPPLDEGFEDDAVPRDRVRDLLVEQVRRANISIFQAAQSDPQYAGMGTTLVTGAFRDNALVVAHVGDSRMYRLRGDTFQCITRDHSLLQEQIDAGLISPEDARHALHRNLVTRALGVHPGVEVDVVDVDARPGDVFLFCSDGLNDMVSDEDIAFTLGSLAGSLPLAARQLVRLANDNGGRDNISVVLVRVLNEFAVPRSLLKRLRSRLG
jgi:protein phosphatase